VVAGAGAAGSEVCAALAATRIKNSAKSMSGIWRRMKRSKSSLAQK
jgi:hypothetical protein